MDQASEFMAKARDILLRCLKRELGVDKIEKMSEFLVPKMSDLAEVKNLKETILDLNARVGYYLIDR